MPMAMRPLSPLTEALECCCRNCLQEALFHTFEFFPLCLLQCFLWPNKLGPGSFSLYIQGLITEKNGKRGVWCPGRK